MNPKPTVNQVYQALRKQFGHKNAEEMMDILNEDVPAYLIVVDMVIENRLSELSL